MTDLDHVREMIAAANMRYSITVCAEGATITARGHRDQNPLHVRAGVELEFTPDGQFITLRGTA